MTKKNENNVLGKIPNKLTFIGIVICLISIMVLLLAVNVLFY